ncbi:chemotaxis protein CheD [Imhoffiella purpurea]|uniref:Probable chemoreceptor glutamine deamidase CheD n=1 Tax=Imhoffiella purpurea TaxID=1249627 RepID=W9V6E3_9GAMM|nr:chemotaxis protein CheD [Imhoffiella purpurea]EXJ14944.1 Chemotaxis protein CheD [Imhoffiella purpurea]
MTNTRQENQQDIYVYPCDIWFGGGETRLRTVLGSCVAVTLWHPTLRIGGLCHFMISRSPASLKPDRGGCYADSAMAMLEREIEATGRPPHEFEAKLFGGGIMFPCPDAGCDISTNRVNERNIAAGRELAKYFGHPVVAEHLGGHGHRQLVFDVASGLAWLKHSPVVCEGWCRRCKKEKVA